MAATPAANVADTHRVARAEDQHVVLLLCLTSKVRITLKPLHLAVHAAFGVLDLADVFDCFERLA